MLGVEIFVGDVTLFPDASNNTDFQKDRSKPAHTQYLTVDSEKGFFDNPSDVQDEIKALSGVSPV